MTITYMRFTITGEYITQQARNFWTVDEQPERAIELLEEVEGLSTAQVLDILEGRSKLAGDSTKGITLEPDNAPGLSLKATLRKLAKAQREAREDAADYAQVLADSRVFIEPEGPPAPPVPEAEDHITSDTGWLSPAGEFYSCQYGQHNNTAYALGFSTEELDKNGWVRVQHSGDEQHFFRDNYDDVPSAQGLAIEAYCRKEEIKMPWYLTLGEEDALTD